MAELTRVFGIDLGTTYSAVANIDEFDRPTVVPNDINAVSYTHLPSPRDLKLSRMPSSA